MAADNEPQADETAGDALGFILGLAALGGAVYMAWKNSQPQAEQSVGQPPNRLAAGTPATGSKVAPRLSGPDVRVEGWVIGTVGAISLPPEVIREATEEFRVNTMPPIYVGSVPIYPPHDIRRTPAVYGPPKLQLIFALDQYPSGALNWGEHTEEEIDIIARSPRFVDPRGAGVKALPETLEVSTLVDRLVDQLIKAGWQYVGKGETWWSHRLKKRYEQVEIPLKWR